MSVIQQISVLLKKVVDALAVEHQREVLEDNQRCRRLALHQKGGHCSWSLQVWAYFAFLLEKGGWLVETGFEGIACAWSWPSPTLGWQKIKQAGWEGTPPSPDLD